MSAWIVRQKLFIEINRRNNETNPDSLATSREKEKNTHNGHGDHPRKAEKYVQRLLDELEP